MEAEQAIPPQALQRPLHRYLPLLPLVQPPQDFEFRPCRALLGTQWVRDEGWEKFESCYVRTTREKSKSTLMSQPRARTHKSQSRARTHSTQNVVCACVPKICVFVFVSVCRARI